MKDKVFTIEKSSRKQLSRGTKIYRIMYGLIVVGASLYMIARMGFTVLPLGAMVIGLAYLIYGIIGKGIVPYRSILMMDQNSLLVKKTYEMEQKIDFKEVSFIKVLPMGLEVSYKTYVKNFDFSWLSPEEFNVFIQRLKDICREKSLECE